MPVLSDPFDALSSFPAGSRRISRERLARGRSK